MNYNIILLMQRLADIVSLFVFVYILNISSFVHIFDIFPILLSWGIFCNFVILQILRLK